MYLKHFSLTCMPFDLLPDPKFLYLGKNHDLALTSLRFGLESGAGFTVITGDIGAGKTTLIRAILNELTSEFVVGLTTNTHKDFGSLLEWILLSFSLEYKNMSDMERYEQLTHFLLENYAQGKRTIIIIDEAQNLESDTLEKLRVISNLNADHHKILQIILAGQPELRETLRQPELKQFAQRVTVDFHVGPLPKNEIGEYIHHRIKVAGCDRQIFTSEAMETIGTYTSGVPRLINLLCNNAMVYAFADRQNMIGQNILASVIEDNKDIGLLPFGQPDSDDVIGQDSGFHKGSISSDRTTGTKVNQDMSIVPRFTQQEQEQTAHLAQVEDRILALYAKGLTTSEIVEAFRETYDADVSPSLISYVTDRVIEKVIGWQNRPLDAMYPVVYLDHVDVRIRQDKRVINKSLYLALGINLQGHKELLGLWLLESQGSQYWRSVLAELKGKGLEDILVVCVGDLEGFADAIEIEFPGTRIQLSIAHMIRDSLKLVLWKDYKNVTQGLKRIYQADTANEARTAIDVFAHSWGRRYPQISHYWHDRWDKLVAIFEYPPEIRKIIYTINAVESLNSVMRKATRKRKLFPSDDSALMVVYLAVTAESKKWTMPIQNWKAVLYQFSIKFGDRVNHHL